MPGVSSQITEHFFKSLSKYGSHKKAQAKDKLRKPDYCYRGTLRDEKGEVLDYPPKTQEKRIKHLSSTANSVISYSVKVLSTTVEELRHGFDETTEAAGKEPLDYARSFLEYCSFKAFSLLTLYEDHLNDINFRRYSFDCMVAWEAPLNNQQNVQDDNYEPRAKEEEDEDASFFYTDLMPLLVDVQNTTGIDAFVRIAPHMTTVADTVNANFQFETLTAFTSERMPFPVYEKYLAALEKKFKELEAKQEYDHVHDLPVSHEELVLEVDGVSQTVIQHVGSKSVSGRLTLTDYALYFEESSIMSYRDAFKLNLAADLKHEVIPDLSGPWGSRIFDKAIAYTTSSLATPIVFEFPDLIGSARRDYWLALIQEVIDCHSFIRKYHLDELCQSEALARAVLGIVRLQAMRDCTQVLPSMPGILLIFNLAEGFLSWGDLVLEALANTIKDATMHATEEEAKSAFDKSDGSIKVPNSAVKLLQCMLLWRDSKPSAVIYRVKPGQLTPLERAVREAREISKQTQKVKALEEEVKLEGIGTNIAVMRELSRPVVAFLLWIRDVISWNRPLETFHFAVILAYIIYRDCLGYLIPFAFAAAGMFILWLRLTNKASKYEEIVVQIPSGGVNLNKVVTAQRAVSQFQGILQAANVVLLKTWALALGAKPEVTNLLPFIFFSLAVLLSVIPFRVLALAIHVAIFMSTLRSKTSIGSRSSSEDKLQRRFRELWHSIPPLPVRIVETEEEKNVRESLQA